MSLKSSLHNLQLSHYNLRSDVKIFSNKLPTGTLRVVWTNSAKIILTWGSEFTSWGSARDQNYFFRWCNRVWSWPADQKVYPQLESCGSGPWSWAADRSQHTSLSRDRGQDQLEVRIRITCHMCAMGDLDWLVCKLKIPEHLTRGFIMLRSHW